MFLYISQNYCVFSYFVHKSYIFIFKCLHFWRKNVLIFENDMETIFAGRRLDGKSHPSNEIVFFQLG